MNPSRATAASPADARQTLPSARDAVTFPAPGASPHGSAETVSVQAVLERGARSSRILGRLCRLAALGPICLQPADLAAGKPGVTAWTRFCELLDQAASRRNLRIRGVSTCIHSHHLPLRAFHAATDSAFGDGERFVFLDGLQMQSHRDERIRAVSNDNWTYLWRDRSAPRAISPVYGGIVKSACPLLSDEVAQMVVPGPALLSPRHSAWLPVRLDLSALADRHGAVEATRLRTVVRNALLRAEDCFDEFRWPGRRRQVDACLNRRIALIVSGIGDLVQKSAASPADLGCLQAMQQLVCVIRHEAEETSAALARRFGDVPSLSRFNPAVAWSDGAHARAWRLHFDAARRESALRHRNLLAMSPYSVLPTGEGANPDYMDLLPLIGAADVWCFGAAPALSNWNVTQFKHFHRRARAVIQASQGAARVAAGV